MTQAQPFRWQSLLSGTLGATASCLAKVALAPDSLATTVSLAVCDEWLQLQPLVIFTLFERAWTPCHLLEYLIRSAFLLLMVACNALMLGSFLRGMDESGSVVGPALTTASNFCVSALLGYSVWGERHFGLWWAGFSMVIAGVMLLSTVQVVPTLSVPTML